MLLELNGSRRQFYPGPTYPDFLTNVRLCWANCSDRLFFATGARGFRSDSDEANSEATPGSDLYVGDTVNSCRSGSVNGRIVLLKDTLSFHRSVVILRESFL